MKQHGKATLALPLAILLSGALIPLVVSGGGRTPALPADAGEPMYAGRTAVEWCTMATKAMERGEHDLAIRYFKTAEKVEPGAQYASELTLARRERRRALAVERERARLFGGSPDSLCVNNAGRVTYGHRTVVVLPGESLWTLARAFVAADRGVTAGELTTPDGALYAVWDALTSLNGLRELDVGETVLLPLPEWESAAMSEANARELEAIEQAIGALDAGKIDRAASLREQMVGPGYKRSTGMRTG